MQLEQIADIFDECFHDAAVFERSCRGTLIETDVITKEKKQWVVIAAGIDSDEAQSYFRSNSKRAERACEPVNMYPSGQLSLLIVVRPVSLEEVEQPWTVTTFAPGHGIPFVQLRTGSFMRCWDIADPESRVQSLRWELDIHNARRNPLEEWLNRWQRHLQCNPAHPASHLHINAPARVPNTPIEERIEHSREELRLGVGVPNPLELILSVATWLRSMAI